jgi:hypothetical protein
LWKTHHTHCAAEAIRAGSDEERKAVHDELLGMIYKNDEFGYGWVLLVLLSSETLGAQA